MDILRIGLAAAPRRSFAAHAHCAAPWFAARIIDTRTIYSTLPCSEKEDMLHTFVRPHILSLRLTVTHTVERAFRHFTMTTCLHAPSLLRTGRVDMTPTCRAIVCGAHFHIMDSHHDDLLVVTTPRTFTALYFYRHNAASAGR